MKYPTFNFDFPKIVWHEKSIIDVEKKYIYYQRIYLKLLRKINDEKDHDKNSPNHITLNKIGVQINAIKDKRDIELYDDWYDLNNFEKQTKSEIPVDSGTYSNNSKMQKVYSLVLEAQKDTNNFTSYWQKRFEEKFPKGYLVELGRIRDLYFKGKKININGMGFYGVRKGRKPAL